MNATKTKPQTKLQPAKETRAAIERLNADPPQIIIDGAIEHLPVQTGWDWYLVNTDAFLPHVARGSVMHVFLEMEGTIGQGELGLVAGNGRLEIRPAAECKGVQVIGIIWEIRRWPLIDMQKTY